MVDVVNNTMAELKALVESVSVIQKKVVNLYDQDDLLDYKKKLGFPAVGIVYVAMRGKDDKTKTGLAAEVVFDIYILGGDQCTDKKADLKTGTIKLLDDIRDAIRCNKLTTVGTRRRWKFVFEAPVEITSEGKSTSTVLGYVQRWSTPVVLTS